MLPKGETTITFEEWRAEATRRFGERERDWAFACPNCGNVATCLEVHEAGGSKTAAVSKCIGRFDSSRGCDWAAFGLIKGPVFVRTLDGMRVPVFEFGPSEGEAEADER